MRPEYDLDQAKWRANPYYERLSEPVTVQLPADVRAYFDQLAAETGRTPDRLMAFFLRCVALRKQRPEDVMPKEPRAPGRKR